MTSVECPFCTYLGRVDNVCNHVAKTHHAEMMADVDEEMARIAVRAKTPLLWKRTGHRLAYAYCLTCRKVSLGDAVAFKAKHSTAGCRRGWGAVEDLFVAKLPVPALAPAPAPASPTDPEAPPCVCQRQAIALLSTHYDGSPPATVEKGLRRLLLELASSKDREASLEKELDEQERTRHECEEWLEEAKRDADYYKLMWDTTFHEKEALKRKEGIDQLKQELTEATSALRDREKVIREAEETRGHRWVEIAEERDSALKQVEALKAKGEESKKEWKKEKKDMAEEIKELEEEVDALKDKVRRLRKAHDD